MEKSYGGIKHMISFNKPTYIGKEKDYIADAIAANKICEMASILRNVINYWSR